MAQAERVYDMNTTFELQARYESEIRRLLRHNEATHFASDDAEVARNAARLLLNGGMPLEDVVASVREDMRIEREAVSAWPECDDFSDPAFNAHPAAMGAVR